MEKQNNNLKLSNSVGNNFVNNASDVENVKNELFKRGYYTRPVQNGILDKETTDAIKNFQKDKGLKVDGLISPGGETENAIRQDLGYDRTDIARRNQIINDAHDFSFHINANKFPINLSDYIKDEFIKEKNNFLEIKSKSRVDENKEIIEVQSKALGVDPDLTKSIMHIENIRGYYDDIARPIDKDTSLQPMNVRPDLWGALGYRRSNLRDKNQNIEAGIRIIKGIQDRVPDKDIAKIATLYQNLGAMHVSQYGQRVKELYHEKPWQTNE